MLKPYDTGLICGRFQTFHKGHEKLIETAKLLCDRPIILIGSAQESGTERNPFDVSTREKMIRAIYGDEIIVHGISDLTNENDIRPEWGKYLLEKVGIYIHKNPELMIYGNDESRSQWFDKKDLQYTTELIINRADLPISATMVREAMVFDERRKWMEMVNPKLHKLYDELRAQLMEVEFYQNMFKSKLSNI